VHGSDLEQAQLMDLCRRDSRVRKGTLLIAEAIGQEFEPRLDH